MAEKLDGVDNVERCRFGTKFKITFRIPVRVFEEVLGLSEQLDNEAALLWADQVKTGFEKAGDAPALADVREHLKGGSCQRMNRDSIPA